MTPNEAIPPRPKAVVFDLGKVLLEFDFGIAARTLAPASAVTAEEFQRALDQSPLLHDYESGRIDSRRFYEGVVSRTGYRGAEPEFRASFADIFSEIGPMVELHAQLRAGGVPAFVFSNTNEIAVTHIRARFAFFRDFDGHVLSYEVGAMKPLPEIYAAVDGPWRGLAVVHRRPGRERGGGGRPRVAGVAPRRPGPHAGRGTTPRGVVSGTVGGTARERPALDSQGLFNGPDYSLCQRGGGPNILPDSIRLSGQLPAGSTFPTASTPYRQRRNVAHRGEKDRLVTLISQDADIRPSRDPSPGLEDAAPSRGPAPSRNLSCSPLPAQP